MKHFLVVNFRLERYIQHGQHGCGHVEGKDEIPWCFWISNRGCGHVRSKGGFPFMCLWYQTMVVAMWDEGREFSLV